MLAPCRENRSNRPRPTRINAAPSAMRRRRPAAARCPPGAAPSSPYYKAPPPCPPAQPATQRSAHASELQRLMMSRLERATAPGAGGRQLGQLRRVVHGDREGPWVRSLNSLRELAQHGACASESALGGLITHLFRARGGKAGRGGAASGRCSTHGVATRLLGPRFIVSRLAELRRARQVVAGAQVAVGAALRAPRCAAAGQRRPQRSGARQRRAGGEKAAPARAPRGAAPSPSPLRREGPSLRGWRRATQRKAGRTPVLRPLLALLLLRRERARDPRRDASGQPWHLPRGPLKTALRLMPLALLWLFRTSVSSKSCAACPRRTWRGARRVPPADARACTAPRGSLRPQALKPADAA